MGGAVATTPSLRGAFPASLYVGEVVHRRARPRRHSLRYRVFSLLIDLDRFEAGEALPFPLRRGRFGLVSIHPADFGPRDGTSLAAFARSKAREAGIAVPIARVEMLAYPRMLGYAFNPLTLYYLYDSADHVVMLLHEVRNTFDEHHFYAAPVQADAEGLLRHTAPKAFYVSPFNTLEGCYRFTVRPPGAEVFLGIVLSTEEGGLVNAYFRGQHRPLTSPALFKLALEYPLMTAKVMAGIHWEALRLWLKGVPTTLALRHAHRSPGTAKE
ncbi:hypothetical protein SAMN02983003_0355 [Devosia enhydra]|uniref:DUF1365 domain-containing protein n=1 Tax=Devosia enhydra TaxID=665118 RepID=A0A1K2HUH4_9HYPH|nr:DUF1365 domain-containing protein [Devosia enhydra]SFZ81174.1 hypothetical protein SAMN02983003_0355 [Devosia enhydra]